MSCLCASRVSERHAARVTFWSKPERDSADAMAPFSSIQFFQGLLFKDILSRRIDRFSIKVMLTGGGSVLNYDARFV